MKKVLIIVLILITASIIANRAGLLYLSKSHDFERAETILRNDPRFIAAFGSDSKLYPRRKTIVPGYSGRRGYVEHTLYVEESGSSHAGYVDIRVYEPENATSGPPLRHAYELTFR